MIILPNKNNSAFIAHSQLAGRYQLTVRNTEGQITRQTPWFDNLITNNGLDLIFNTPSYAFGVKDLNISCFVGTGSATPVVTDSTLQAYLASGSTSSTDSAVYVVGPPPYWYQRRTYRFGTGVAAGNLSEVGVGAAFNNLFSRSLIKDNVGNPITITVLSDEVLDVTYELRVYPPTADYSFNVILNGVSTSVLARTLNIQTPQAIFNAIPINAANTILPYPYPGLGDTLHTIYGVGGNRNEYGGNSGSRDALTNPTYVIGSYEINCGVYWGLGKANGPNQLWVLDWPHGRYQFRLATPATKTSVKQMNMTFRISWSRYP